MYKFLRNLSCLLCLVLVFGGCRKKAFDEFYNPPANAQPPIYQVLQKRGNFKNLLALIDKGGYKSTLSAAGYWTFFAPNDAAFQTYFTENGTSIDKIDAATARKIVTYCLVFNAFKTDHISDFQSTTAKGWVTGDAFKRRTAYYDGFYKGTIATGDSAVLISSNRNGSFVFGDNNNKYIPYFYSTFMASNNLTAADYNYFYPNTTYTGFNVVNSAVVNADIVAENGVIHEVDHVILPLPSIEQKLAASPNYSLFQSLYNQFITYVENADEEHQYLVLNNKTAKVYIKQYATTLGFSPNNENYLKLEDNDGQSNGYTIFAPNNTALQSYLTNTILEFYKTMSALPISIVTDLLNAHMFTTTVWPSKFATTTNVQSEPARFDPQNDIAEKLFCSNGVFYGTNTVQKANVFNTVYARAYLDPAYSIMTTLLNVNYKALITNPTSKFAVFMLSNAQLNAMGYYVNPTTQALTYSLNGSSPTTTNVQNNLLRILGLNIINQADTKYDITDLSGDGIARTVGTEFIRWHNYTVSSGGTVERNVNPPTGLPIDRSLTRVYPNGVIYFYASNAAGVLDYPVSLVATDIQANAKVATDKYYDFYQYLINSTAYDPVAKEIVGLQLSSDYTLFIPNQDAMKQAVLDGFLPGTYTGTGNPGDPKVFVKFNYAPTVSTDVDQVARFIKFHIITGAVALDGTGKSTGVAYNTLLKNSDGNTLTLNLFNSQPGTMTITDNAARIAHTVAPNNTSFFPATSNYLGTHAILHQIDNYLKFNY